MSGDRALLRSLLPALVDNVQQWTASHWAADPGCFWQYADRDGQEHSIGGDGCRPLLGSVMFGEAHALARIARELGEEPTAAHFTREADRFRAAVLRLWSPELGFFVTRATPRPASPSPASPRLRLASSRLASLSYAPAGSRLATHSLSQRPALPRLITHRAASSRATTPVLDFACLAVAVRNDTPQWFKAMCERK